MASWILRAIFTLLGVSGLVDCWSTSIVEHCVTPSGVSPISTSYITTTRYVEYVSTTTSTPTSTITFSTSTSILYTSKISYATLVTSIYTNTKLVEKDVTTTTTVHLTASRYTTLGLTTTTVPSPPTLTPVASNPSVIKLGGGSSLKYKRAEPTVAIVQEISPTPVDVVCHKKYVLQTTVTDTVTGLYPATVTDYSDVVTSYRRSTISTEFPTGTVYLDTTVKSRYTQSYFLYTYIVTTTTMTTTAPTATAYPACGPDNIISTVGEYNISSISIPGYYLEETALDPNGCCVSCMKKPNCTGMIFIAPNEYRAEPGTCFVMLNTPVGDTCNASFYSYGFGVEEEIDAATYWISNGPCGQGEYGTG